MENSHAPLHVLGKVADFSGPWLSMGKLEGCSLQAYDSFQSDWPRPGAPTHSANWLGNRKSREAGLPQWNRIQRGPWMGKGRCNHFIPRSTPVLYPIGSCRSPFRRLKHELSVPNSTCSMHGQLLPFCLRTHTTQSFFCLFFCMSQTQDLQFAPLTSFPW